MSSSSHIRTLLFAGFCILIATAFSKETACKIWKCGNISEFTHHHSLPIVDFSYASPDESEVLKRDKTQGKSVLGQESMYELKQIQPKQLPFNPFTRRGKFMLWSAKF